MVRCNGERMAVARDRFLRLTLVEERFAETARGVGMLGIDGERFAVARDSVVEVALIGERRAEIEVAPGIGMDRERRAVAFHRLGQLALHLQHGAQIAVGLEAAGLELNGPAVARRRCVEPAQCLQRGAQIEMSVGQPRCQRYGLFIAGDRFFEPTGLARDDRQIEVQLGGPRVGCDELPEASDCLRKLFLPCQGIREHMVQDWSVGVADEQRSRTRFGTRQMTHAQQVQERLDLLLSRLPAAWGFCLHPWRSVFGAMRGSTRHRSE